MPNIVEVIIDGKNAGAIKAINGVKTEVLGLEGSAATLGGRITSSLSAIGPMLATGAIAGAVTGIAALVYQQMQLADELGKTSQKIGISVESLSTLRYVADLSDVSMDTLASTVKKLNVNMYEVANGGGKEAKQTFDSLGISVTDTNGKIKDSDAVFLEVAERLSGMQDGAQKTAIAVRLFGKSGQELIPMLNEGKIGISELQEEARKLGLEISTNTAIQAEIFNDNLTTLKQTGVGFINQVMVPVLPLLVSVTDALKGTATETNALGVAFEIGVGWARIFATSLSTIWFGAYTGAQALVMLAKAGVDVAKLDFSGAADEISKGWDNIMDTSVQYRKLINGIWGDTQGYSNTLGGLDEPIVTHKGKVKDLADEWAKLTGTLQNEVTTLGMGALMKAQFDLNKRVDEYYDKYYGKVPGAFENIIGWYNKMIAKQLELSTQDIVPRAAGDLPDLKKQVMVDAFIRPNKLTMPIEDAFGIHPIGVPVNPLINKIPEPFEDLFGIHPIDIPLNILPGEDQLAMLKALTDERIAESSRVTTAELVNMAMLNGTASSMFNSMGNAASQFYQASGNKARAWFEIQKGFSVAQALINTYEGITKGLAQGGIFGIGSAIAVGALGFAQVANILSQQPGGSSRGSSGGASVPRISNFNNSTSNNSDRILNITVNVNGNVVGNDGWIRDDLIPGINKAIGDGVVIKNP